MSIRVVTPPAGPLIQLADAKNHLRVSAAVTAFDTDIQAKLNAAVAYVEKWVGRALLTQTWAQTFDAWPCRRPWLELAGGPAQSIVSVGYIDNTGTPQILAPAAYQVDLYADVPRLMPTPNTPWPQITPGFVAVSVQYVCGYGSDPSTVPAPIVQAILLVLGDAWINREAAIDSRFYTPNAAAQNLLWPYRINTL